MTAEPDLAQSWSTDSALIEWTSSSVPASLSRWHALTSKDVAATFTAILDPKTASPARTNVGPVARCARRRSHRGLPPAGAFADFPVALAYTNARIVPAAIANGDIRSSVRARRMARVRSGSSPTSRRGRSWWRATRRTTTGRPERRPRRVLVYPDPTAEASALISGDTDLMASPTPGVCAPLQGFRRKALRAPSGQFLNVNMGCDQKLFNDVRVRQALALTIDREAMAGFVAGGYGTPGNDTPLSPAYHFYKDSPLKKPDSKDLN